MQIVQTASQWQLEWSWAATDHVRAEALAAWLLSLRGQVGTFRYTPRQSVTSALTGRSLATAAFAYNTTLSAAGWAANATSTLRAGQWFSIGDQLLRITSAAANADSAGKVTISFEPELRVTYASATTINFAAPTGVFRLMTSEEAGYTLDPDRKPALGTFQAREAV